MGCVGLSNCRELREERGEIDPRSWFAGRARPGRRVRGATPGRAAGAHARGSIDDRGKAAVGSGGEGRRGSIDDRGKAAVGSGGEGRRGSIDREQHRR